MKWSCSSSYTCKNNVIILAERMTVYSKDEVIVRFKNGIEIEV